MRVPIILYGLGQVGCAFLRQLIKIKPMLSQQRNLDLAVVGLADRTGMLLDLSEASDERLLTLVEAKEAGQSLAHQVDSNPDTLSMLHTLLPALDEPPIVIDATAAVGMEHILQCALDQGCRLALANSRALVGPWSSSRRFFETPHVRFEATVGAGLPATRTLRDLLETGDRASSIEGSLSGTVGYICSQLQLGVPFSTALNQAFELSYTEPDPREDLSGQDSARKILVMGRLAGWPLEMRDVQVEQLCSAELASLPVASFMEQVSELNDTLTRRVQVAREEGRVLRYVAEIDPGGGRVGLRAVPKISQLGVLQGPECLVTMYTARYTVSPLTISGRGVGRELAAAALLSDVVCLAYTPP